MSNYVGFQVTCKKDVTYTISTSVATTKVTSSNYDDVATCTESDPKFSEDFESDNSDSEEPSTDIQEVYQVMYNN